MSLTPTDVVRNYYDAYATGDLGATEGWVHPDCVIDEPDFLPYGRISVIGAQSMFEKIGGVFFTLFHEDTQLEGTRYFENGNSVITNAVWVMRGRHTGRTIRCHYQEYFEVADGKITLMRPFYHAAREILEEIDAAKASGIKVAPWED